MISLTGSHWKRRSFLSRSDSINSWNNPKHNTRLFFADFSSALFRPAADFMVLRLTDRIQQVCGNGHTSSTIASNTSPLRDCAQVFRGGGMFDAQLKSDVNADSGSFDWRGDQRIRSTFGATWSLLTLKESSNFIMRTWKKTLGFQPDRQLIPAEITTKWWCRCSPANRQLFQPSQS